MRELEAQGHLQPKAAVDVRCDDCSGRGMGAIKSLGGKKRWECPSCEGQGHLQPKPAVDLEGLATANILLDKLLETSGYDEKSMGRANYIRDHLQPKQGDEWIHGVVIPFSLYNYLMGIDQLDGLSFGEKSDTIRPDFWRTDLLQARNDTSKLNDKCGNLKSQLATARAEIDRLKTELRVLAKTHPLTKDAHNEFLAFAENLTLTGNQYYLQRQNETARADVRKLRGALELLAIGHPDAPKEFRQALQDTAHYEEE